MAVSALRAEKPFDPDTPLFGPYTALSFLLAIRSSREATYREVLLAALIGDEVSLELVAAALGNLPDNLPPGYRDLRVHLLEICAIGADVCDRLEQAGLGGAAGFLEPEPAAQILAEVFEDRAGEDARSWLAQDELKETGIDLEVSSELPLDELELFEEEEPHQGPWGPDEARPLAPWIQDQLVLADERELEAMFDAPRENAGVRPEASPLSVGLEELMRPAQPPLEEPEPLLDRVVPQPQPAGPDLSFETAAPVVPDAPSKPAPAGERAMPFETAPPVDLDMPLETAPPVDLAMPFETAPPVALPVPFEAASPVALPVDLAMPFETAPPVALPVPFEAASPVALPVPFETAPPVALPIDLAMPFETAPPVALEGHRELLPPFEEQLEPAGSSRPVLSPVPSLDLDGPRLLHSTRRPAPLSPWDEFDELDPPDMTLTGTELKEFLASRQDLVALERPGLHLSSLGREDLSPPETPAEPELEPLETPVGQAHGDERLFELELEELEEFSNFPAISENPLQPLQSPVDLDRAFEEEVAAREVKLPVSEALANVIEEEVAAREVKLPVSEELAQVDAGLEKLQNMLDGLFMAEPVDWSALQHAEPFPRRPFLMASFARVAETVECWRTEYDSQGDELKDARAQIEERDELLKDKEQFILHQDRLMVERDERIHALQRTLEERNSELAQLKILSLWNHMRFAILDLKGRLQASIPPRGLLGRRKLPSGTLMLQFIDEFAVIERLELTLQGKLPPEELGIVEKDLQFLRTYVTVFSRLIAQARAARARKEAAVKVKAEAAAKGGAKKTAVTGDPGDTSGSSTTVASEAGEEGASASGKALALNGKPAGAAGAATGDVEEGMGEPAEQSHSSAADNENRVQKSPEREAGLVEGAA